MSARGQPGTRPIAIADSPVGRSVRRSSARSARGDDTEHAADARLVAPDVAGLAAALDDGEHRRRRHEERVRAGGAQHVDAGIAQHAGEVAPAEPASRVGDAVVPAAQPAHPGLHEDDQPTRRGDADQLADGRGRVGVHAVAQRGHAQHGVERAVGMGERVQVGERRQVAGCAGGVPNALLVDVVDEGRRPPRQPRPGGAGTAGGVEVARRRGHRWQVRRRELLEQLAGRAVPPVAVPGFGHPAVLVGVHAADTVGRRGPRTARTAVRRRP